MAGVKPTPAHSTTPLPPLLARLSRPRERRRSFADCLLAGALAAALGLGVLGVLVLLLWISSPYPDSGPGGALHLIASLWLLAHGAGLVRGDTLTGGTAPLGLTPLLLLALPAWLVHRAARDAARDDTPAEPDPADPAAPLGRTAAPARTAWGGVVLGYLLTGAAVTAYAEGGWLRPSWPSTAFAPPLLAACAAALGVWTAAGHPWPPAHPAVPAAVLRHAGAARAAVRAVPVLLAGGALLAVASLVRHRGAAGGDLLHLTGGWSGRLAVLLLCLALLPNAAVWGAGYALGPGFLLGAGHPVGPLGTDQVPLLPRFPLLAALPGEGSGTPLTWAVAAVPVVAAVVLAHGLIHSARSPEEAGGDSERGPGAWQLTRALRELPVAALLVGLAVAGLAALSGGPLGGHRLAAFGPQWWAAGAAAAAWTAAIGAPCLVLAWAWSRRTAWWRALRGTGEESKGVPEQQGSPGRSRSWRAWLGFAVPGTDQAPAARTPAPSPTTPGEAAPYDLSTGGYGTDSGTYEDGEEYGVLPAEGVAPPAER
ncbi:DUF6350 family protein [Streptomyces sp. NPDC058045]|uniref:cell division protein PerM n=1 Tax=Streptomyces sp. NPDC058045 TaxID=3346311 RepID=UPI0036E94E1A